MKNYKTNNLITLLGLASILLLLAYYYHSTNKFSPKILNNEFQNISLKDDSRANSNSLDHTFLTDEIIGNSKDVKVEKNQKSIGKNSWYQYFPQAKILNVTVETSEDNNFLKSTLLESNFKFPYVQIDEIIDSESENNNQFKAYIANQVLVEIKPNINDENITQLIQSSGGTVLEKIGLNGFLVQWPLDGINTVRNIEAELSQYSDKILVVEPNYFVFESLSPNDPKFSTQWALNVDNTTTGEIGINAEAAWDTRTDAENVIVAIIDSGIRYTHNDIKDNMWTNLNEIPNNQIDDDNNGFVDDYYGYDFINNDSDPNDDRKHGTSIAGIIGARGNNDYGMTGICWKVKLMALKFLDNLGKGVSSDAIKCIDYAQAHGAHVTNNSWGGMGFAQSLFNAVQRNRDVGIPFIVASGNDGADIDVVDQYPAKYDLNNVITVGNLDYFEKPRPSSNFGKTSVDLFAPGRSVLSLDIDNDDDFILITGTSIATAQVSGVMALLIAEYPNETMAWRINRIFEATIPSPDLTDKCVTGGYLRLRRALTGLIPATISTPPTTVTQIEGYNFNFSMTVNGDGPFTYQWMKNGVPIPNATQATLQVDEVAQASLAKYTLQVTSRVNNVTSAETELLLQTVSSSYKSWIEEHFNTTEIESGIALLNNDPDMDGFSNNQEFALVTIPNKISTKPFLKIESNQQNTQIKFNRQKNESSIQYVLESSTNFSQWDSLNLTTDYTIVGNTGIGATAEEAQVQISPELNSNAARYFRLKVVVP